MMRKQTVALHIPSTLEEDGFVNPLLLTPSWRGF
jgi:hypothetical protein